MTTPGNDSADRPSRELPDRPNLRHLKDEAKSRVKSGEFAKLSDAQFAIAREFGFASWQKLHHHVEDMALRNLADDAFERDDLVAFFAAVRNDRPALVARILEAHPEFVNARIDPAHWSLKGESFARAITDGRSADPDGTSTQTALHHDADFVVVAIAVKAGCNRRVEVVDIAGSVPPLKRYSVDNLVIEGRLNQDGVRKAVVTDKDIAIGNLEAHGKVVSQFALVADPEFMRTVSFFFELACSSALVEPIGAAILQAGLIRTAYSFATSKTL